MKKRSVSLIIPILNILVCFLFVFSVAAGFFSIRLMIAEIIAATLLSGATFFSMKKIKRDVHEYFTTVARTVEQAGSKTLGDFAMPVMVTNKAGEITWYNEAFRSGVIKGVDIFGEPRSIMFSDDECDKLAERSQIRISVGDKKYNVYEYKCDERTGNQRMYFFVDDTHNFQIARKYRQTRPCIMYIHVDGLDVLLKNAMESQKTEIRGAIEKQIEHINDICKGYLQRMSSSRYVFFTDREGYEKMVADKFSVLANVRTMSFGERGAASLSIGVGIDGESITECVEYANNALDMALGRGGDQAAIKNKDGFEFFGGVTQAEQVNSRVRTRVISATLKKLIENSEKVMIMGHSFSDMDCIGAAFAMYSAVSAMGKPAVIVADENKTLAGQLIERIKQYPEYKNCIVDPRNAEDRITKKTLLIIVDTHRPSFLENKQLYEKAPTVVIVDHHRKTVDFIDNSLLFYHDPSASSTCEMVTEMLQYMGNNLINKPEAEALLAGIMLDTRSFVLRTGARTFEASAYLRGRGANPIDVKKLFSDSLDTYTARMRIIANAKVYDDCAISICPDGCSDIRVASSQAADELLSVSGVNASFVIYETDKTINISARSLGGVNVQLIMEQLGGGGHQTMAAAQIECASPEEAKQLLLEAIQKTKEKV